MKVPTPVAIILAQRANDTSRSAIDRAIDYVTLGSMAEAGTVFVEVPDDLYDVKPSQKLPEPKYIWHNGARVKVKNDIR